MLAYNVLSLHANVCVDHNNVCISAGGTLCQ